MYFQNNTLKFFNVLFFNLKNNCELICFENTLKKPEPEKKYIFFNHNINTINI